MTLEKMLSNLTHSEKLAAMDLLWRDLSRDDASFQSPDWHAEVLAHRMANPEPGPSLSLEESMKELRERLHARRTKH